MFYDNIQHIMLFKHESKSFGHDKQQLVKTESFLITLHLTCSKEELQYPYVHNIKTHNQSTSLNLIGHNQ